MGTQPTRRYYGRASELLRRDKGWWKVLLVMGVAACVPVVGYLGCLGYCLEWARLTAWGVDSAPKQKKVRVGECIKSGWRGFVSMVGWLAIWAVVYTLVSRLVGSDAFSFVFAIVCGSFLQVVFGVAMLHATLYKNFKAGYKVKRLKEMFQRDGGGIAHIWCTMLVIMLCIFAAAFLLTFVVLAIVMTSATSTVVAAGGGYGSTNEELMMMVLLSYLSHSFPAFAIVAYAIFVGQSFMSLILYTELGLWMREFDVPLWGTMDEPLPPSAPALPNVSAPYGAYAQGGRPSGAQQGYQYGNGAQGQAAQQQPAQSQPYAPQGGVAQQPGQPQGSVVPQPVQPQPQVQPQQVQQQAQQQVPQAQEPAQPQAPQAGKPQASASDQGPVGSGQGAPATEPAAEAPGAPSADADEAAPSPQGDGADGTVGEGGKTEA